MMSLTLMARRWLAWPFATIHVSLEPLLATLESGDVGSLPLEAATALADPRLNPALVQLRDQWEGEHSWEYKMLEEAIVACAPVQS